MVWFFGDIRRRRHRHADTERKRSRERFLLHGIAARLRRAPRNGHSRDEGVKRVWVGLRRRRVRCALVRSFASVYIGAHVKAKILRWTCVRVRSAIVRTE